AGSLDQTAWVLDAASGETLKRLVGHQNPIQAIGFAPNGAQVLTASGDPFADDLDVSLRLWDIDRGQQVQQFGDEHTQEIYTFVFTPDGEGVISGDGNSDLIRYDMLTLDELIAFTQSNRYGRDLTCAERALFNLPEDDCP
ncbi:MAG: hypothetical protein AAF125_15230, partial [Chloroflexota bacterium]